MGFLWDVDGCCWGAELGIWLEEGVTRTKSDYGQSRCTTVIDRDEFALSFLPVTETLPFLYCPRRQAGPSHWVGFAEYQGCITDRKGDTYTPHLQARCTACTPVQDLQEISEK